MAENFALAVVIGVFLLIIYILYKSNIELRHKINEISVSYERQIREIKEGFDEEIKKARRQSVQISHTSLQGKMLEQITPILPGFPYLPSDCRFLGEPIDYLVINGYTECLHNGHKEKEEVEIVIVEVKTGHSGLSKGQRLIAEAVKNGRVRFEVFKVLSDGSFKVRDVSN